MTTNSYGWSAKIYQFPAGGRAGLGSRRDEARPVENFAASRVAGVASGNAWYHEEAVQAASASARSDISCRLDAGASV